MLAAKRSALALNVIIVQDNFPIEIAPKVYISSIHTAFSQEALHSLNIKHVSESSIFYFDICLFLFYFSKAIHLVVYRCSR
jgi:hypothetical protein